MSGRQRCVPLITGSEKTPRGADASAILYSIVETAKLNGLIPGEYISATLKALATTPPQEIAKLLPTRRRDQGIPVKEASG